MSSAAWLAAFVRCGALATLAAFVPHTASSAEAGQLPAAPSQGEQDVETALDRLLDGTLEITERLARTQYSKAEELLTSLERQQAGGNPATSSRDRRRAIKVRQLLLKLHRQQFGEIGEVVEKDCYAIAWMSAAVDDRQEALDHYECYYRAISARLGPNALKSLEAKSLYADALALTGRMAESDRVHRETIDTLRRLPDPPTRELASALMSYATMLDRQSRFDEYEAILRQFVAASEAASGTGSETHLFAMGALINFLNQWDRSDEADTLTWQAYTVLDRSVARDGFVMALASWRAGRAALRANQPEEALQLYGRSYELHLRHMGREYLHLGSIKVSMAQAQIASGRRVAAKQTLRDAIRFFDHDDSRRHTYFAAQAYIELGRLLFEEGAVTDAAAELVRAEAILSGLDGGCSAALVQTRLWTSRVLQARKQGQEARSALQVALPCARRLVAVAQSLRVDSLDARLALKPFLTQYIGHALTEAEDGDDLFEAMQLANVSETSATVVRVMSASLTESPELAGLVRRREDLIDQLRTLDRLGMPAEGRLDREAVLQQQRRRPELESSLAQIDRELSEHPDVGARTGRDLPVTAAQVARALRPKEALIVFHFDDDQGVVWVTSGSCRKAFPIELTTGLLARQVAQIRRGLGFRDGQPVEFDAGAAHHLYRALFSSIEGCLTDVEHLFVVAPGPLGALPIGVLPLRQVDPKDGSPIQWLLQRYSVSIVPSAATLVALRPDKGLRPVTWRSPFFGMGDPIISAPQDGRSDGAVNPLRELPDTAVELRKMAATLGASKRDVFVREAATADVLAGIDLSVYKIVAFATHGLSASEVKDRGEPALVLSRSRSTGSSLLLASDVAKLNLTADLVLLSACNTAVPSAAQRGVWLSGLTRAFFRAGARAVLASHWYVSSVGTAALTTQVLNYLERAGTAAGKAQALRLAALELIESRDPLLSHPVVWGAFSLVGDGGTNR